MSEIQNIIDALEIIQKDDAWHGPGLRKILAGVNADMASARPIAGGHTIWELVRHIQAWEGVTTRRLEGQQTDEPDEGDFPSVEGRADDAWRETLAAFDQTHELLIKAITHLQPADLEKTAPGKSYTIGFELHGIVRHHVYHAGQIAILKKALTR